MTSTRSKKARRIPSARVVSSRLAPAVVTIVLVASALAGAHGVPVGLHW